MPMNDDELKYDKKTRFKTDSHLEDLVQYPLCEYAALRHQATNRSGTVVITASVGFLSVGGFFYFLLFVGRSIYVI